MSYKISGPTEAGDWEVTYLLSFGRVARLSIQVTYEDARREAYRHLAGDKVRKAKAIARKLVYREEIIE